MTVGTQVQIHFPGHPADQFPPGRLVGFYSDEPCRAVVALPSGEELVVMETDLELLSD